MIRRAIFALCLAGGFASGAWAQLATQTALVGTVTDGTGSVIPGATVVAVNSGTQDTYETVTNDQGYYNIQFIRTGKYEITVALAGFQTSKATGVEVATNQIVRRDVVLQVGGVTETVTVEAAAVMLSTESATISESINQRAVADLPLTGRNVYSLATTTPGVQTGNRTGTYIGAGQRDIQNSLSLDGINSSANLMPSTSMRPIADAVTEVQVQTGSTSAEYGSYLGVHINVVTKSGTNDLHGSLFEFYQSDALEARGFFEDRSNPKNPRRRDQFGVQVDGPLRLPKLYDGRNKTFFMAAYEGIRQDSTATSIISVPTALMRQGNFSEFRGAIRNPFTGALYPNNIVPQSELSPIARRVLDYLPAPNRPGTGANLLTTTSQTIEADQFLARVDQNIGNRVRLYVRYNWQDEYTANIGAIPVTGTKQPRVNKNTLVAYTHTLTPRLFNDFRIGYHRVDEDTLNHFEVNGLRSAGAELGIPGFDGDVRYGNAGIPHFTITGFQQLDLGGTNWYQFDTTFQVSNVLAYSRGNHNIRAGFDARRMGTGRRAANSPRGSFSFNGDMTGYPVADFMLGLPRQVTTPVDQLQGDVGGWRNGFFVNDNWQATRDLTLSLGLRYELNTPVQTYTGFASMLNEEQTALIPERHPTPGFKFHEPNLKDIAPRVGATYRLTDKTVLRAGYGIYYNPNQMNTFTFLTNNPPLAAEFNFISDPANPTLSLESPFGVVGPGGPPNVTTPTRDLPNARKNQWSFDVQRELWQGMALDLQYLGSRTKNLDRSFFNNTPQPGPGAVDSRRPNQRFRVLRIIQNDLVADYDAFSVILRKRMSHGLQASAHYTWSRTRDMATNSNAGGQVMNQYDIWADYGPSNWDIPHRFVASYIYDMPFFRNSSQPVLRYVLSGWQVGGITTLQSGNPINVTIQGDRANTGIGNQRPDVVGTPSADCGADRLTNCIDASAFALPALYTFGNASRNLLRGPGRVVTDLAVIKSFPIAGPAALQMRVEIFNAFNRANFDNPGAVFGTATFGRITAAQPMRRIELGGKLLF
jgi:hypothetical protein